MSSDHPTDFTTVPAYLSAGDQEMRGYYTAQERQRPMPNTAQSITPYLGLRSRLSQVWINRWTVLTLLVLVRILIAVVSLNNDLDSAKTEAMSACSGVESMGSAMASMPHYLSAGINELAASGVEKAVSGLMQMLLMTITGIEELIVFYINFLYGTYECLIVLAISGSLHVALKVIEDAGNFLNSTLKGIGNDIETTIDTFSSEFNSFTKELNSIPQTFGDKSGGIPTINVNSSLDKLNNLQLPDLDEGLAKLNGTSFNFTTVQNFTNNLIRFPFEELKTLVGESTNFTFNRSLLPVPQKEQLAFCSDSNGISDFFASLADVVQLARRVFLAVLIILAILVCIPMAYQEIRRWRTMQQRAKLVNDKSFDPLDVIYIASRPYTATAGIKAASPFNSSKRQVLVRWVIAYATSPPALLVLSLGIAGLLSCLCQYILLKSVEKEVPALANEVTDFAQRVVSTLNNASATWADGTNHAISGVNDGINHDLFGWVNKSTTAVNGTLNGFLNETTNFLNTTFGGSVLYDPVTQLFDCLLGYKIENFEQALTWINKNARVDFPLLPNDTFSLGAAASIADTSKPATGASPDGSDSFLASPGSEATDKITNAVVKVTTHITDAIRTEAIISGCILIVWIIILLIGVGRATYLCFRSEKVRGEGGPEPRPQRPFSSIIRGPAPAYEPPTQKPKPAVTTGPFASFSQPIPSGTRSRAGSDGDNSEEEKWATAEDEKRGHAGFCTPAREESPIAWGVLAGRKSVYPALENEKS